MDEGGTTMMERMRKHLLSGAAIGIIGLALGSPAAHGQDVQRARVAAALDQFAAKLSAVLTESGSRSFVTKRIEASKTRVVALRDLVAAAAGEQGAAQLAQLGGEVRRLETALERAGAPVPRLDLKLPVKEHQRLLGTSKTLYVLAAPLEDESEVKTLRAWSNRQQVTLDPKTAPKVPTLVLIPGESESLDPTYPLETRSEAPDEENPKRVDDFVGIAKIRITDDHESWVSGDPEIYAVIVRNQLGSSIITPVALPGVNNENVWYFLGDPNSTYLAYGALELPSTTIDIWEEDNFAHGADDFLGRVTFDWTTLNFSGYTTFSNGDMKIQVDRD